MNRTIELRRITVEDTTINYEIYDNTGLHLLKKDKVKAFVRFFNAEAFGFTPESLPQSILAVPITLYLLPVTYFYNVELVLPCMDKDLHERLPEIYNAYSKIYGPFKSEWRGKVVPGKIEENKPHSGNHDKIVFFSGGLDALSAGVNNPGEKTVLVSIPSIESQAKNEGLLRDEKFSLIKSFSRISGSPWLLVSNNFNEDVFYDDEIQQNLKTRLALDSKSFNFDGWFGIKYLGNMCSVAPFAYARGIREFVMGSGFEQEGEKKENPEGGANPELSDSIGFAGMHFAEQDELYTRRSVKTKNIIRWCNERHEKVKIWTCFSDDSCQCGICSKCVRTQLNILCAGENPKEWGFERFSEKTLSHIVRSYRYWEATPCWVWDICNSVSDTVKYPYCDETLHWLKTIGYKTYFQKANNLRKIRSLSRIFKIHRYPHYVKVLCMRLKSKVLA